MTIGQNPRSSAVNLPEPEAGVRVMDPVVTGRGDATGTIGIMTMRSGGIRGGLAQGIRSCAWSGRVILEM
jgi:hypothetical protein